MFAPVSFLGMRRRSRRSSLRPVLLGPPSRLVRTSTESPRLGSAGFPDRMRRSLVKEISGSTPIACQTRSPHAPRPRFRLCRRFDSSCLTYPGVPGIGCPTNMPCRTARPEEGCCSPISWKADPPKRPTRGEPRHLRVRWSRSSGAQCRSRPLRPFRERDARTAANRYLCVRMRGRKTCEYRGEGAFSIFVRNGYAYFALKMLAPHVEHRLVQRRNDPARRREQFLARRGQGYAASVPPE